jgi:hypothetical protein
MFAAVRDGKARAVLGVLAGVSEDVAAGGGGREAGFAETWTLPTL